MEAIYCKDCEDKGYYHKRYSEIDTPCHCEAGDEFKSYLAREEYLINGSK